MSRQPDELPPVPGERHASGTPCGVPDRCHVLSFRAAVVYVPCAFHRAAGGAYAHGTAILPATAPAVSGVAAVAAGTGDRAVSLDHGATVPAQAAEYSAYLVQGDERIRRVHSRHDLPAAGGAFLGAAGAGAYAIPHRIRGQRVPWLGGGVELATT